MRYTKLGKTEQLIPVMGQGTWKIGGGFTADYSNDEENVEALRYGISHGLSLIDTAEAYGVGHCEELVGQTLGNLVHTTVATKVSPENLGCKDLIAAAERSLKRLNRDCIDLYQIHWPNPEIPIEETAKGLNQLKKQGKIRFVGVSNFSVKELIELNELCEISSVQSEYNIFDRFVEYELLPYCKHNQITFLAYTPLDFDNAPEVRVLAEKHGISPQKVALRWLLDKDVVPIPKAVNRKHIKDNASVVYLDINVSILNNVHGKLERIPTKNIACDSANLRDFVPSFRSLGESLKDGVPMKPIRVRKKDNGYVLTEGKIRYWAWVHAFREDHPCPALVRGDYKRL